jgi:serine phosphatase RsbU (regulator of sigma subunit)
VAKFFIYRFCVISLFIIAPLFSQSAILPESLGDPRLDTLYNLAYEYLDHSPDSCVIICTRALATAKAQSRAWAAFLSLRSFGYEHQGYYRKALQDQFRSMEYFLKTKNKKKIGTSYNNLGVIYDYMGNLDSAEFFYRKSYGIRKKLKDIDGLTSSAGNLGLLYLNKGEFNKALDYLFESEKLAKKTKDQSALSSCYVNIGLAYDNQGNNKKALEYYKRSVAIDSLLGDAFNLAIGYNNIGSVYFTAGAYNDALKFHLLAFNLRMKSNNRAGLAESYRNLAMIYLQKKEFGKAEVYFGEAIKMGEDIDDAPALLQTHIEFGNYYLKRNNPEEAVLHFEKAIKLHDEGAYGDMNRTYDLLAKAWAQKGDYKKAYDYFVIYKTLSDSVNTYENSKELTEHELNAEYEHRQELEQLKRNAKEKHDFVIRVAMICGILALLVIVAIVFRGYRNKKIANEILQDRNAVITSQHAEIEMQKQEIEEKNKDITDSIHYALRLQNAMLPPQLFLQKHLNEYFILFKPKDIVSGDFYWAHECGNDKFLFAVVDCTGHGVPGSMVSIIANNALNRAVDEFKLVHPADILNKLAELVEEYFNKNSNDEIRDGMDISLCLYNRKTKQLEFAGANNSLWIVRKNETYELVEVKADKQPIGRYEYRKAFTNHIMQMQTGDWVYLHTDGYGDQFGGPNIDRGGKKFKSNRLKQILTTAGSNPSAEKREELEKTLAEWARGYEQNDDICIMGIRID